MKIKNTEENRERVAYFIEARMSPEQKRQFILNMLCQWYDENPEVFKHDAESSGLTAELE
jgi:hypothetical protein